MQKIIQSKALKLDVEYGNSKEFFSASKSGHSGLCYIKGDEHHEYSASINGAAIDISDTAIYAENEITRSTQFSLRCDSALFDLVSRFVVLSDDRCAFIKNKKIKHECKNIYHQYETDDVVVPVGSSGYLKFSDGGSVVHPSFDKVFYIRDEAVDCSGMRRWIVHHRMIVDQRVANLIVRSCHPRFEGPLPLQWIIPKIIKKSLFRIRERKFPNFPIMAVGESFVERDYCFKIGTRVRFIND